LLGALSIQPRIALAYRILGKLYEFAGEDQPAIRAAFSRYLSSQPRDAWAYYYQGRIQYLDAHSAASADYGPAAATLRKALALKPDLAEAHLQLGVIALDEERPKNGVEHLLAAIRLSPRLAEAHYRLGVAYNRLGDTERAVAQFELHEKVKAEAQKDADNEEVMQFLVSQNPEASLAR
jgi:tetratricopeptide (TPR) repeat protein